MNKTRELLFSVTRKDFVIEPFKGSGAGGQHRNKTMSCVRIRHPESGAEAIGTEHREQSKNKRLAFRRVAESKRFQTWIKIKACETVYSKKELERRLNEMVDRLMRPENIRVEIYDSEKKKWVKENVERSKDNLSISQGS